uniref:Peptidase A2 domain-containing protein n=1 Tax=Haemonchus placei TaxID=6290 RepID=A0A0N4WCE7_HAEPC
MAEFNVVNPERMKCLVWICGLASLEDADIRARALRKMEDNSQSTLKELAAEIQQFLNILQDATLPEWSASSLINADVSQNQKHHPPSPCLVERISQGSVPSVWQDLSYLRIFRTQVKILQEHHDQKEAETYMEAENGQQCRRRLNACWRHFHISHLPPVHINGKIIRMRLDIGADVTLLSNANWIAMGRPMLSHPRITLRSSNDKPINVRGCSECNFVIDGHHGRGICYVADTPSLLGLDLIIHEPLFRRLRESSICNVSSSMLTALNSSLTTRLKKKFFTVHTPGSGQRTKSNAKLTLKCNVKDNFQKARLVPYAAIRKITDEIVCLVSTQVLTPIDHSEWAALLVLFKSVVQSCREVCAVSY